MKKRISGIIAIFTAAVIFFTSAVIPVYADNTKITVPNNEATQFVDKLGAGWNLGNCFDAFDQPRYQKADEMIYETIWCHDKATKELIKTVKQAGFSTVRLPATWLNHVDKDFNISDKWLARYMEVADWCLDEGLYVIVDVHHDVYKGYYYPDKANYKTSKKYMKKIWSQLSKAFKDYDERVIFEIINEPRLTGTNYEWWYDQNNVPAEVQSSLDYINRLNQLSIDTVRAAGGKNTDRYIMVGGYDTDWGTKGILSQYFKWPTDTAKDRLIAAVHFYGISASDGHLALDGMYNNFVSKGIPCVVTEYGLNSEGYQYDDKPDIAAKRFADFVSYARERGISVVLWDNNVGGKGVKGHRYIDRATAKVTVPTVVQAFVDAGKPANADPTKPVVTATAGVGKVKLTWNKIEGATKYVIYQYKSGKYSKVKSVSGTSATIKNLHSGRTFRFIVRAYVNGKLTPLSDADAVKVKTL